MPKNDPINSTNKKNVKFLFFGMRINVYIREKIKFFKLTQFIFTISILRILVKVFTKLGIILLKSNIVLYL